MQKLRAFLTRLIDSHPLFRKTWPVISLCLIGCMVHGAYITRLGFYWDDWPVLWNYNANGTAGITDYFAGNRPFSGALYASLFPYLGASPLPWHFTALILRCASCVFIFSIFISLWPQHRDRGWLIALFVMIYPGFAHQPIALSYIPHLTSFCLFTLSLALTARSLTDQAVRWLPLAMSLVSASLSYLIIEYFIGLEFLRLTVIFVSRLRSPNHPVNRAAWDTWLRWLPFAVVFSGCIAWRAFFFRADSYGGAVNGRDVTALLSRFLHEPVTEIGQRLLAGVNNMLMGGVLAWMRPIVQLFSDFHSRSLLVACLIASCVVWLTLRSLTPAPTFPVASIDAGDRRFQSLKSVLMLGLIAITFAGVPFLVPGLTIVYDSSTPYNDRYAFPFAIGSAMLLLVGIALLTRGRSTFLVLVSIVVFLGTVFHIQNANKYRRDWLAQRSLFWQLAWRAPKLMPGTGIFIDGLPISLTSNCAAGMLNLLYLPDHAPLRLTYYIYDLPWYTTGRLATPGGAKLSFKPGDVITGGVRNSQFSTDTSQSLVSWVSSTGTLRILAKESLREGTGIPSLCREIACLSDADNIQDTEAPPAGPLLRLLGSEPPHDWYYYYQKAAFDGQFGRWKNVVIWGDRAIKLGYAPLDKSEWIPFIEAYIRCNRLQTAIKISNDILDDCPSALLALSHLWHRVEPDIFGDKAAPAPAMRSLRSRLIVID